MRSRWLQQRGIRRRVIAVTSGITTGITLSAAGLVVVPTAAIADPAPQTVAQAKAQVDKLQQQADAADQDYLALKEKLDNSRKDLKDKQADLKTETAQVATMRSQISKVALAQFQNEGLDARAQLFLTQDPTGFLNQFGTIEKINENQNTALQNYQVEQANLADLQRATKADIATLKTERTQIVAVKKKADGKVAAANAVLDKLTAQQREAIKEQEAAAAAKAAAQAQAATDKKSDTDSADKSGKKADDNSGTNADNGNSDKSSGSGSNDDSGSSAPASGKGAAVVAFAKAQIGKPYVFGATGPGSYDCSGLALAAWASAGVQLPRTSQAQYGVGSFVSTSNLEPGDLVFFYGTPPDHVGIYVGNGVIIHAPHPGESVQYAQLSSMPYVGARRPA